MRHLITKAQNSGKALTWLSNTINRNTGWLIATAIVCFGLSNLAFLKDNEAIVRQIDATTENTESITKDTKTIITNLEQAVDDLLADNGRQTRILCRLILRGNVELSSSEADEVERICQETIDRVDAAGASTGPAQTSSPTSTPPDPSPGKSGENGKASPPSTRSRQAPFSGLIDPTIGLLARTVDRAGRLL